MAGPVVDWHASIAGDARRLAFKKAVAEAMLNAQAAVGSAKLTVAEIAVTDANSTEHMVWTEGLLGKDKGRAPDDRVKVTVAARLTRRY